MKLLTLLTTILFSLNIYAAPSVLVSDDGLVTVTDNEKDLFNVKFDTSNDFIEAMPNTFTRGYKRIDTAIIIGQCLLIADSRWSECHGCGGTKTINIFNLEGAEIIQVHKHNNARLYGKKIESMDLRFGIIPENEEGIVYGFYHVNQACQLSYISLKGGIYENFTYVQGEDHVLIKATNPSKTININKNGNIKVIE